MKRALILLCVLLSATIVWSQVPQKMNYQTVIRSDRNELVTNTRIDLQVSILQGSAGGAVVYTETLTVTTNENGLASFTIGRGTGFESIDWAAGPYFIKTEAGPTGGTSYTVSETSQILSVPFALHSGTSGILTGKIIESDPLFEVSVAAGITESDMDNWNNKQGRLSAGRGIVITDNMISINPGLINHEEGKGIASLYPGDEGIEHDKSVVFTENFEGGSLAAIVKNWTWSDGTADHRLSLDTIPGPEGTQGHKSLKMTILRDKEGDACGMRKIFDKGYEQLFFRFYVKFADDYGFNHHFTSMGGDLNPAPYPIGRAGERPVDRFSSAIDQSTENLNLTGPGHTPPGFWFFYSYWPEMRSWQTVSGVPDGRPNPYYGNPFMPKDPVPAKRGEWQCIEIMMRVNTAPDKEDGAQAFWIDGKLAGCWDPLEENPVEGYWIRDIFRSNPDHKDAKPFSGIKWRNLEDPAQFEKLGVSIIRLQNYVSGTSWEEADKYAADHSGFKINLREATVWKDHIVVATEYIGPIQNK